MKARQDMYKQCKTERSEARQRLIENTLFDMMRHGSYDDITVTELCDVLKMPRKAFYRYFDDKDSALRALIAHTLEDYVKTPVDTTGPRYLSKELSAFFNFWIEKRELLEALDRNGRLTEIMTLSLEFPLDTVVSLDKLLPNEEPAMRDKIYRFAIGGLISIVIEWFRDDFATPVDEITRLAVRVLTKPPFPILTQFGMTDF